MDNKNRKDASDPGQRKWDNAGPDQATGRTGGEGGASYNEGPKRQERTDKEDDTEGTTGNPGGIDPGKNEPATGKERRFGGSHTAGTPLIEGEESKWKGGTPSQGPTTGGMGAAGGGHDTDETDVWGDKDRT